MAGSEPRVGLEVQQEILNRVATGEKVGDLAKEFGISYANIYNWISKRRDKDPAHTNKEAKPHQPPQTLDDQIDALTQDYQTKLKALLIKQLTNNLRMLSL